ncbi:MAG: tetratricopeptide repeat protein [Actinomycetes bacterium]
MSQTPSTPPGPRLNLRGAVDLSALSQRAGQGAAGARAGATPSGPGGGGGAAGSGAGAGGAFTSAVVDVTDATFGDVVQQSMTVPVVLDLWATWCEPCKQLSPVLERLAGEHQGAFLLAKVDVDANPQIAAAFQVQSIPMVVAVVKGQPVPLFQGALPESQVRQVLTELLKVAEANGVRGRVPLSDAPTEQAEELEEELPPLHQEAYDAIDSGDFDAAAAAYRKALAENPADDMARVGLGQVELLRRTSDVDLDAARAAAAADPHDVDAVLLVADADLLGGDVDDAFRRLVELVRATAGTERERVRVRLVELFDVVGGDDPRVAAARRDLASALF